MFSINKNGIWIFYFVEVKQTDGGKKIESDCGNTLEKLIKNKSYTVVDCGPSWGRGRVGPGWNQAGRQQEHGSPGGQIITHPDGAATWYSLHTLENIPALDKSVVRDRGKEMEGRAAAEASSKIQTAARLG